MMVDRFNRRFILMIIGYANFLYSTCNGVTWESHYFEKQNHMTWIPDRFRTYTHTWSTHCAHNCLDLNPCIGFLLEDCSNGVCSCSVLTKYKNDSLIFSFLTNHEVWVRMCPEGYECIPAGAVPPRCYKVIISSNNMLYEDAKKMCGNDGVDVYLIAPESRTELEEVARDVMPRLEQAGKQATQGHFFQKCNLDPKLEFLKVLPS